MGSKEGCSDSLGAEQQQRPVALSAEAAADLHDKGLHRLKQGDSAGAESLLRSALQERVPSEPSSPGKAAGGGGSDEDDWETGLEDSLLRLNVALSSRPTPPPPTAGAAGPAAAAASSIAAPAPQFRGRGARHFSNQCSDDEDDGAASGSGRRELNHVLEFYALPPQTRTSAISAFLQPLHTHPVEPVVSWVDDNHALVLFPTADCARHILEHKQNQFKIRPFREASEAAHDKSDSELLPPKPRPKTTDVVARRMLSHALGRSDLVDVQGERRLAQARRDNRAERQQRQEQLQSAWGD